MAKLAAQYNVVLVQAYIIDEALELLKKNRAELVRCVGMLAYVWARWNLEADDKFRQNEVLLIMSALIYNTVNVLERSKRKMPDETLAIFQPACEFFLLLLHAVEWPKTWKAPLIGRVQAMFPKAAAAPNGTLAELKDAIMKHPFTQ